MQKSYTPLHFPASNGRKRSWGQSLTSRAKFVLEQVESRDALPEHVWGSDPLRVASARAVSEVIAKFIGWPNAHFIPEDPFELVMFNYSCDGSMMDGLEDEFIALNIEELLGCRCDDLWKSQEFWKKTFGEVLDALIAHAPDKAKLADRCRDFVAPMPGEGGRCPTTATFLALRRLFSTALPTVSRKSIRPDSRLVDLVGKESRVQLGDEIGKRFFVPSAFEKSERVQFGYDTAVCWIVATVIIVVFWLIFGTVLSLNRGFSLEKFFALPLFFAMLGGSIAGCIAAGTWLLSLRAPREYPFLVRKEATIAELVRWICEMRR